MGRIGETIARTWQLAAHMKDERGSLPEDDGTRRRQRPHQALRRQAHDQRRRKIFGIDHEIGSLEPGKLADIVLWEPELLRHQARGRVQGRLPRLVGDGRVERLADDLRAAAATGPQWGAVRAARGTRPRVTFMAQAAIDAGMPERLGLRKRLRAAPRARARSTKRDLLHNDALPEIRVDPETYRVEVDGELCTCEPMTRVPLGPLLRPQVSGRDEHGAVRIGIGGPGRLGQDPAGRAPPAAAARRESLRAAVITNDLVTRRGRRADPAQRPHRSRAAWSASRRAHARTRRSARTLR